MTARNMIQRQIELYGLDLNIKTGDYDTNIAFKIKDKDLVLNEFKLNK